MNTGRKFVERRRCTRCGVAFLQIGQVKIRSIRLETPDFDFKTGYDKLGLCNSPRCARFGQSAVPKEEEDANAS